MQVRSANYGFDRYDSEDDDFFETFSYDTEVDKKVSREWLRFSMGFLIQERDGSLVWSHSCYDRRIVMAEPLLTYEDVEKAIETYGIYAIDTILKFSELNRMDDLESTVWPVMYDIKEDHRFHSLFCYVRNGDSYYSPYFRKHLGTGKPMDYTIYGSYGKKFFLMERDKVETIRRYIGDRSYHMQADDVNYELFSRVALVYDIDASNAFTRLGTDIIVPGMAVYVSSKATSFATDSIMFDGRTIAFYDQRKKVKNVVKMNLDEEEIKSLDFEYGAYDKSQFDMHVADIFSFLFCSSYKTIVAPGDFGVCLQVGSMLGKNVIAGDYDDAKVKYINKKAEEANIKDRLLCESYNETLDRQEIDETCVIVLSHMLAAVPEIADYVVKNFPEAAVVIYDHTLYFKGYSFYKNIRPFDYAFFVRNYKGRPLFRKNSQVYGKPISYLSKLPKFIGIEEQALLSAKDHAERMNMRNIFCSYRIKILKDPRKYGEKAVQLFDDVIDLRYFLFMDVNSGNVTRMHKYTRIDDEFVLPCVTSLEVLGKNLRKVTVLGCKDEMTLITKAPFVIRFKDKYRYFRDVG